MGVLEVRCQGSGGSGSGPYVNIFHVSTADGDEQIVASALPDLLQELYSDMKAVIPTAISWSLPERVLNVTATPPEILPASPQTVTGTGTSPLSPQLAVVVSWLTASAGRAYRGRTYFGPLSTDALGDNGQVNPSAANTIQNAAVVFRQGVEAITGVSNAPYLCVYHGLTAQTTRITGCVARTTMYTQRRRN